MEEEEDGVGGLDGSSGRTVGAVKEVEAKGSQVRFEVALGDWVATGVWVERLVWGNVSASRKETPPPPWFSVSEVRLPRVRVKRIFACVHAYTGCPVLMCERPCLQRG